MADLHLNYMDGFSSGYVRRLEGMEDNGKYWIYWEVYFKDSFRQSPAMCARYNEVKSSYPDDSVIAKFAKLGCRP